MKIILSQKLLLLSVLQYINGYGESYPRIKEYKSELFQNICYKLFQLKSNPYSLKLIETIKNNLFHAYKEVFLAEIEQTNNSYIFTLLEQIEVDSVWKQWFLEFSQVFKDQIEKKINSFLEDYNKESVQRNLLKSYNIDISDIYIIYNGLSNFDFISTWHRKIYYCAGDFLGYDELSFTDITPNKNCFFFFHLLSKIFQPQIKVYLNSIPQNIINTYLKTVEPVSVFQKCWNIDNTYDFLVLNISFYYAICEVKRVYPNYIKDIYEVLNSKGIYIPEVLVNDYEILSIDEFLKKLNMKDINEIISSKLPSVSLINEILSNSTDYYKTGESLVFKTQLNYICSNNDYIFIGEFHNCNEHFEFLANTIKKFYSSGYENIFWEKSKDCQEDIDAYIYNKTDLFPNYLNIREKPFLEQIREINKINNHKLHIYCYDLSGEELGKLSSNSSSDNNFEERENKCFSKIQETLKGEKSIFLLGYLHTSKVLLNSFKSFNENLFMMIKNTYSSKKCYSMFINSFYGRFRTAYSGKVLNCDIDITSSFIIPYDITAHIFKHKDVISFINFEPYQNTNNNYIGYTEFGNISFDNNISTLSSCGFSIHKIGEAFDGMLLYPNVDWMKGDN
jgi:hypothetical protein